MKNHIVFSIQYAGLLLPVYKNEAGQDVTPFKPIVADVLGLDWMTQYDKVTKSPFLMRELGVAIGLKPYGFPKNQEPLCLKLDRVVYYMMTINPDRVRANGNITGAEYLEAKISEWADALHDYEELGIAINLNHARAKEALRRERMSFMSACKIKSGLSDEKDRKASEHILKAWAQELGATYQPDLLDTK